MSITNMFAPRRENLDITSPRTITDFAPYKTIQVIPEPFGSERAREILQRARDESAGAYPWANNLDRVMTIGERAYVLAVWETIPSGGSTFISSLLAIATGF